MLLRSVGTVLAICAMAANAQSPVEAPRFEVASIKPCTDGDKVPVPGANKGGAISASPGRLYLSCRTLEALVQDAYVGYASAKPWPIDAAGFSSPPISFRRLLEAVKGGPAWIRSEKFTVEAKPEKAQTQEMMRGPMMQALIEDRFRLKFHREAKKVPVYLLTVARGGPRLRPAAKGSCVPRDGNQDQKYVAGQAPWCGWFRASPQNDGEDTYGQTMAGLCSQFSAELDRDVIDKTGIEGRFDIHLDLPSDPATPAMPADQVGALSDALQKLGLRLESGKERGEFLVIDSVERPSEN